jgi:hypothetical protein
VKDGRITKDMLPAEMIELAKTGMPATGNGAPRADHRGKLLKAFLRTHLTKKGK